MAIWCNLFHVEFPGGALATGTCSLLTSGVLSSKFKWVLEFHPPYITKNRQWGSLPQVRWIPVHCSLPSSCSSAWRLTVRGQWAQCLTWTKKQHWEHESFLQSGGCTHQKRWIQARERCSNANYLDASKKSKKVWVSVHMPWLDASSWVNVWAVNWYIVCL